MARRGFSLVELLLALLIGGIIVLMIGALSSSGLDSYNRTRGQAGVYNELAYSRDRIDRGIRRAHLVTVDTVNNRITIDNDRYQRDGNDLAYFNITAGTRHVLIGQVTNLSFIPSNPLVNLYRFTISGRKDAVDFNQTFNVTRRNR